MVGVHLRLKTSHFRRGLATLLALGQGDLLASLVGCGKHSHSQRSPNPWRRGVGKLHPLAHPCTRAACSCLEVIWYRS